MSDYEVDFKKILLESVNKIENDIKNITYPCWFSVDDNLPAHMQTVLAKTTKGFSVVQFVESIEMNKVFNSRGLPECCVDIIKNPYSFCSQEIRGNVLNNVTHWMALPEFPTNCQDDNASNGLDSGEAT